jgi:hypothetical protein
MSTKKQAAATHSRATVSHAASEVLSAHGAVAPGTAEGTISFVLFTAACRSMVKSRLPPVLT